MTATVKVKNVARRVVFLDGGQPLEHEETGTAPDTEHTRAQIDAGELLDLKPKPAAKPAKTASEENA